MPPIEKKVLHPGRLRRIPGSGFSWVDRRFVTGGFAAEASQHELLLYLLLCTVADRNGLSFYDDRRLGEILKLSTTRLEWARRQLERRELIVYRYPLYQVLSLPDEPTGSPDETPPPSTSGPSTGPSHIGEVIGRIL
ncbi:MAG: hypothetical protein ACE5EF_07915 [Dehalococcoidia bacterium]